MSLSNRVNMLLLVLILAVGIAIVSMLATNARGGPLDPPAPPASTLPQVEPRMPIPPVGWNGTFPITITDAGSYFLTRNLVAPPGSNGIVIAAQRVTLDLNGFTLAGHAPNTGIADDNLIVRTDVVIRNGVISGWRFGVWGQFFVRSTFEDLRVTGDAADTVAGGLTIGSGNTVERVTATENKQYGLAITQQGSYYAGTVADSNLSGNGNGIEILANNVNVRHNVIDGNNLGVYDTNSFCWIEDNDITGNTGNGVEFALGANQNTVVRNFMVINTSGAVLDNGTGNRIGPFTATASSTDAWSNIVY